MDIIQTITGFVSLDILIITGIFAFFLMCGVRYGKGNLIALIMSLYIGMFVYINFPYLDTLTFFRGSDLQVILSHIGIFILGVLLIQYPVRLAVYAEYSPGEAGKWMQAGLLAAGATALTLAFAYRVLPISVLYDFSASIDAYFTSQFFFWWLVAPLAAIAFVARR